MAHPSFFCVFQTDENSQSIINNWNNWITLPSRDRNWYKLWPFFVLLSRLQLWEWNKHNMSKNRGGFHKSKSWVQDEKRRIHQNLRENSISWAQGSICLMNSTSGCYIFPDLVMCARLIWKAQMLICWWKILKHKGNW